MLRSAVNRTTLVKAASGGSSSHADGMHPNLGLHNAAATGNIGLVKFALENGQPANSNLNGILPLHAACSGGNEQSVRMLIFHGADVNASRLKAKGAGGGPGAEGSTPLHFAAANGHLEIVRILLEAGARPAAADKDGIVPEALALGNGHTECAHLIRSWISAYGSNGLAGMVEARDTVSGDVTLGPAGYIRYAASGRSASPRSPTSTPKGAQSTIASTGNTAANSARSASVSSTTQLLGTPASSGLTTQSSFDTLATASASKLPSSRSGPSSKSGSLSSSSSNPNLRNQASAFTTSHMPVASPASLSVLQSHAAGAAVLVPGPGGFTSPLLSHDSSDSAAAPAPSAATRSSSTASSVLTNAVPVSAPGGVRESKRRPSLPSILERAAHPAASLRAALASGSSTHIGGSMSQASSSRYLDQSYDGSTTSPGKKHGKLPGKRSLSNMLRKATGSSSTSNQSTVYTPPMHASSSSFFADASAASSTSLLSGGAINMDALAKPGRVSGKSFDYQRPSASSLQRSIRRNTPNENLNEDPDTSRTNHIIHPPPSIPTPYPDAAALDQRRRLRNASSSSSLSAAREYFLADGQVRRARAGSNEQAGSQSGKSASRLPLRANASLDLLRPGYFSQGEDQGFTSAALAGRKSVEKYRATSNQNSRIDAMKRAGAAQALETDATSWRAGDLAAVPSLGGRNRSVSGSSSRSAGTTDNDRSHTGSTVEETADEDDLQEFLDHYGSEAGDQTLDGGERHDSHRLPAALRSMTSLRQQNASHVGDSLAAEAATGIPALTATSATSDESARSSSMLPSRMTRNRSGSHVSAISSGSQSGHSARGMGSTSIETNSRNSPGLAASFQALSIAEENGLTSHSGHIHGTGSSSTSIRAGRAPSVADSLASRASSSSLRSNYLSAAEQAQAILNQDTPYASDGPDGTSTSLATQLAAYGEALALERRRAGDARSGPSPSLSARGSNAALRPKLPSVSEDQSPSRSASHSSRSFSVSENRKPNLPATAAQSYNNRVSRRPHSSEGRQSQDSAKRGLAGSSSMTIGHYTLSASERARLDLDRSQIYGSNAQGQGQGKASGWQQTLFPSDSESVSSSNLTGVPDLRSSGYVLSAQGWDAQEQSAEAVARSTTPSGQGSPAPLTRQANVSDSGEEAGPVVPPKDHLRRLQEPVMFHAAPGMPVSLGMSGNDEVTEVDDEDEDDPKTPVLGGNKAVLGKLATSPRSLHRHSPSLPTELSSYTAARHQRSPGPSLADSGASTTTSLTPPVPPPRKESIHVPELDSLSMEDVTSSHISSDTRMLTPDSAMWSSWRAGEDETSRDKGTSLWEGLRRPSLNMLRSATSSSTQSQTQSHTSHCGAEEQGHSRWSTDESAAGRGNQSMNSAASQTPTGTGKRRLVRNLLNKAKGSS